LELCQGGETIGIAPWYSQSRPWSAPTLRFMGDPDVCPDHLSCPCIPGLEEEVAAKLAQFLRDEWGGPLELSSLDGDDSFTQYFRKAMEEMGFQMEQHVPHSCWVLPLPSLWEDYLRTRSSNHRNELRRLSEKYLASGLVCRHRADSQSKVSFGLETLFRLKAKRQHELGGKSAFRSKRIQSFHHDLALSLLGKGQLRLSWLSYQDRPFAVLYDFVGGENVCGYSSGIDTGVGISAPGKLLLLSAFEDAIKAGFKAYDFLRGDEPYKAHWKAQPQEALTLRTDRTTEVPGGSRFAVFTNQLDAHPVTLP